MFFLWFFFFTLNWYWNVLQENLKKRTRRSQRGVRLTRRKLGFVAWSQCESVQINLGWFPLEKRAHLRSFFRTSKVIWTPIRVVLQLPSPKIFFLIFGSFSKLSSRALRWCSSCVKTMLFVKGFPSFCCEWLILTHSSISVWFGFFISFVL